MSAVGPMINGALASVQLAILVAYPGPFTAAMFAFGVGNFLITLVTFGRSAP